MEGFIHELILCCLCLKNDCQQSLSAASDCNPCCDNLIVSVLAASVSQNTTNNLISKLNFKVKFISYKTKLSGTGNELVSVTFSSVSTIYNLCTYECCCCSEKETRYYQLACHWTIITQLSTSGHIWDTFLWPLYPGTVTKSELVSMNWEAAVDISPDCEIIWNVATSDTLRCTAVHWPLLTNGPGTTDHSAPIGQWSPVVREHCGQCGNVGDMVGGTLHCTLEMGANLREVQSITITKKAPILGRSRGVNESS